MSEQTKEETKKAPKIKPVSVKTTGAKQFCRAGVRFSDVDLVIDNYTPEQLSAWQNEPELIVEML